ncbi:hypothetical protein PUN28_016729 [Cardiocondyla obscurior]|uniref:Uncharacterized protein n=1 Tax=Cardiocondyla obscurior TaxID=286306 RepID=A0AAW2ENK7_9HYME
MRLTAISATPCERFSNNLNQPVFRYCPRVHARRCERKRRGGGAGGKGGESFSRTRTENAGGGLFKLANEGAQKGFGKGGESGVVSMKTNLSLAAVQHDASRRGATTCSMTFPFDDCNK